MTVSLQKQQKHMHYGILHSTFLAFDSVVK